MRPRSSRVLHCFLQFFALLPLTFADISEEAIHLNCLSTHMSVSLDLRHVQWLDPGSLHLLDPACKPKLINSSAVAFSVPLQGCGTRHHFLDGMLIYSNALCNSERNGTRREMSQEISRFPLVRVPFHCNYRQQYQVVVIGSGGDKREYAQPKRQPKKEDKLSLPESREQQEPLSTGTRQTLSAIVIIFCTVHLYLFVARV